MTVSSCRLKFASVTFFFFEHELLLLNIDFYIEMGLKSNFSNNLITKDQIAVKSYARYLV